MVREEGQSVGRPRPVLVRTRAPAPPLLDVGAAQRQVRRSGPVRLSPLGGALRPRSSVWGVHWATPDAVCAAGTVRGGRGRGGVGGWEGGGVDRRVHGTWGRSRSAAVGLPRAAGAASGLRHSLGQWRCER